MEDINEIQIVLCPDALLENMFNKELSFWPFLNTNFHL